MDGESDNSKRRALRFAEAGGALIGGVVVALFTVGGTLAGLPVIRAAIYGLVVLVVWSLCVLHACRRAARLPGGQPKRHGDSRLGSGQPKRREAQVLRWQPRRSGQCGKPGRFE